MTATAASTEFDNYLAELKRRWWTLHYVPDATDPEVIAGVYWHEEHADVVVIFGPVDAIAYRTPMVPGRNAFQPKTLVWSYKGAPTWAMRDSLLLPAPEEPNAPRIEATPLAECQIFWQIVSRHGRLVVDAPMQPLRAVTVPPAQPPLDHPERNE